ncbi:MAG: hypothetical protein OIF48_09825 [Silicimonas sp.]|nr:hypothetical protein [Silicimonas sp.]
MTSEITLEKQAGSSAFVKIVAIGDPEEWQEQGNPLPSSGTISFLSFQDLAASGLGHLSPEVIYSPVLAGHFDCIDMAMVLSKIGFDGTYKAYAKNLPKPEVIEREVRNMCDGFSFEIVQS